MIADWFTKALLVQYIGASFFYWLEGNLTKAMYWFGAACLTWAVLRMK